MNDLIFDLQRFSNVTVGGNYSNVNTGSSNDYIYNNGYSYVTITAGSGKDTIYSNNGSQVLIAGGSGNDTVFCRSNYSTVSGGSGSDTVSNITYYSSIHGGSGNDSIYNNSYYSTIAGGLGNDKISFGTVASGNIVQFTIGDGNDTIYDWKSDNSISLQTGVYYTRSTVGSNVVISLVSGGSMTLVDASNETVSITGGLQTMTSNSINSSVSNTFITANDNNNSIINTGSTVTVHALGGSDTVRNHGGSVTISGGEGNDSIRNYGVDSIAGGGEKVSISGGTGNDQLSNWSNKVTMRGDAGNDSLNNNSGDSVVIDGGANEDILHNWGNKVTIAGGTGNDSLANHISSGGGEKVSMNGGAGNDSLYNYANKVTMRGDSGNDSLYNYQNSGGGSNVLIDGGADDDFVDNWSDNVTISGGDGNDLLHNHINDGFNGEKVSINGGAGNDTIDNYGSKDTINGGAGNDRITFGTLASSNVIQFASGGGFDTVYGWVASNKISLQSGAYYTRETLDNGSVLISLLSGGSMTLSDAANKTVKITGGIYTMPSGINTVISSANITFNGTNYNDTISNSGNGNKIFALAGNDSLYNNATNVTIGTGAGKDTVIIGYTDSTSIDSGADADFIQGHNNRTTITTGDGNDTVTGNHYATKIVGGDGNDSINITYYWYNTIDGGDGADSIYAEGGGHSVNGGAGADFISLSGSELTVKGGTGNDIIYGDTATSHLYQYTKGDGNDTLYNWSSNDTLTVSGGSAKTTTSGKNIVVSVTGGEKIILANAKGKTVNVNGKITGTASEEVTPQDVIKNFMLSLDNATISNITTMLDNAVKFASNNKFTTIQKVIDSMVSDCASYSGDWDSFLKDKCDINLDDDNYDTGAITGSDAGGSTTKTKNSVVVESGSVDKNFDDNHFDCKGLNVYLAITSGNTVQTVDFYDDNLLDDKKRYIWQGLKDWWLPGALNLIEESYGDNFSFNEENSTSTIEHNTLFVTFYNDPKDTTLAGVKVLNNTKDGVWRDSEGNSIGALLLKINMSYYSSIIEDNADGKMSGSDKFYLDRVLSHEFTHAVMDANIKYATGTGGLPQFIKDGMSELTHGIDDDRKEDIKAYAGDSVALNATFEDYLTKISDYHPAYACGYMFLRYFAKQSSTTQTESSYSDKTIGKLNELPKGLTRDGALLKASSKFKGKTIYLSDYSDAITKVDAAAVKTSLEITGNESNNSIKSGKGADKLYGGAGKDTLYGGASSDILFGGSGNDKLYGEAGNDTLRGGTGNDSLKGGAGKDIFVYEGGKDYIVDFTAGEDKIQFLSGSVTKASASGNNLVLKTEDGAITIKGGKGKQITVIDADGMEATTIYGNATQTLTNSSKAKVTLSSAYMNANASKRTKAIRITGNALANSIMGGTKNDTIYGGAGNDSLAGGKGNDKLAGQAGNDTLWGGAGNDSLWGGAGNDIFLYKPGTGNDVILDYTDGDMLQILDGKYSKSKYSKGTLALTIGSGSVTFKNVTTSTTFNINDKLYEVSGSKLAKK